MSGDPRHIPLASYEQAIRNNKILTLVVVLLTVLSVVLSGFVISLFPLKTTETIFYSFDRPGDNFVRIDKVNGSLAGNQLLVSSMLRRYVKDRETIDRVTEIERYPNIMSMSSNRIGNKFREEYGGDKSPLQQEEFKRQIRVVRDSYIDRGIHQVEFVTEDFRAGRLVASSTWVASLAYEFDQSVVAYEARYINPIGIFVTEYSLAERRSR